ncbi:hypothetical protein BDW59DRAFT_46026 [Aspergillus cavernicola]|uniref:DUF4045 domain-containing protein n=1 Tax=Aspergillus cavernicola TaxID=176166 RepID=A0ABR4J2P6_9EURO
MNVFRKTRKESKKDKAKENGVVVESSAPTSFGSMLKKGKKEPEPQPELDLSSALPSTDDFRTSLLMPKLSARFSMLREQDDPESLIGKASDDSVLFPRRASRLNLFGHNPSLLSDIDEASDCSRPSFNLGRGSYASGSDGYAGDDEPQGSIMSRARRVEGNNLFGGRQKVYKIAGSSGTGRSGRAVYEHDIGQSTFQREKRREAGEGGDQTYSTHDSEDAYSSVSSTKRTTYSSTASGPVNARISTAATSVDEQSLATSPVQYYSNPTEPVPSKPVGPGMATERGSVRTRRLYGQALEQSVHSQQTSALHRLESLNRQRSGTPEMPPLNRGYSRSASNLRDRLHKLAIAEPSPTASRPTSPPSSATSPTRPQMQSDLKPPVFGQPPLSPPVSENEESAALMAALQPKDLGKATAMGMFNKPRTAYDENQFSRRQLQMFQGRNTPPLRQQSPARAPPQDVRTRPRGLSNTSHLSRPGSAASSHYSEAHRPGSRSTGTSVNASPARPGHIGTFFDNSSPSETEDEGYGMASRDLDYSFHNEHPALRSWTPSKPSTPTDENSSPLPEVRYSDLGELKPIAEHSEQALGQANLPEKPDSPTLPSGLGLSGLVRTHLRHDSDKTSIFPPPSPRFPQSTEADFAIEQPLDMRSDLASRPPTHPPPPIPTWKDDLIHEHRREGSTETQKEREEFAIELAERRRRVQEKLRDFAEGESRAASPVSGRQTPDPGQPRAGNAFALLKNKSGKNHLFNRAEPRGMKGLGFGGNASTPTLVSDDPWGEEERIPFPNIGKHGNSSSPQIAERSMRSRIASFGRRSQDESGESSRSRGESPHSSFRSRRDRSSSDASGRSKSRSRRERDDLGTLEEDDTASDNSFTFHGRRRVMSVSSSTRPSVEVNEHPVYDRSPSSASGIYHPESRSATPSNHDRPFHAPVANSPLIGAPRPSPAAPPFSANATPPLQDLDGGDSSTTTPPAPLPQHAQALPQRAAGLHNLPKRPIIKSQISEPTFISCTSNVPTIGLPAGASLNNGMVATPPLPPMNPRRRRQTTTQTILGAFKADRHDPHPDPLPDREPGPEQSTFSDEEKQSRPRNRLRKVSSEGGELNANIRQTMSAGVSPAPAYPPRVTMDGGMF